MALPKLTVAAMPVYLPVLTSCTGYSCKSEVGERVVDQRHVQRDELVGVVAEEQVGVVVEQPQDRLVR